MTNVLDITADEIFKLIKDLKIQPIPEKWLKEKDIPIDYMHGFVTAFLYCKDLIRQQNV